MRLTRLIRTTFIILEAFVMEDKKKKVTFDDIAKYTNFSKTTISRYFNNPDSLTLKNQEIIAQALIDLDYQENKLAKVLANGKANLLEFCFPICFCTITPKC